MLDLVIKSGLVVTPQGVIHGGVAIEGGRIVEVGADAGLAEAKEVVDVQGLIIFPGIIDPHHHIGIGPPQDWDKFQRDMADESIASAVGGVTTIVTTTGGGFASADDIFPNVKRNKEIASQSSLVDFEFTGSIMSDDLVKQIPRLVKEQGVTCIN